MCQEVLQASSVESLLEERPYAEPPGPTKEGPCRDLDRRRCHGGLGGAVVRPTRPFSGDWSGEDGVAVRQRSLPREELAAAEKEVAEAARAAPPERLGTRAPWWRWRCPVRAPPAEAGARRSVEEEWDPTWKSAPQPLPGAPNVGFVVPMDLSSSMGLRIHFLLIQIIE